ncbi:MAG: DUF6151 family protein [Pseudomonadales bacterium]
MPDVYTIRCRCGTLTGALTAPSWTNRVICYCDDCQAFAEALGHAEAILDARGGSDILQTAPRHVCFSGGREHLACLRLKPNGLLRWYADCCRTPIANTPANPKFHFVGLLHNCLEANLDAAFGPPRMRAHTAFARGEPKPSQQMPAARMARIGGAVFWARLTGRYRQTPFFDAAGNPVAAPTLVSA